MSDEANFLIDDNPQLSLKSHGATASHQRGMYPLPHVMGPTSVQLIDLFFLGRANGS